MKDATSIKYKKELILVIKHGGLGEIVMATGAFRAIREYHKNAHIILLTTSQFENFAMQSGCFDEVWIDSMPRAWQYSALISFIKKLRSRKFSRVYDLQNSVRSEWYFRLSGRKKPEWSGSIDWCSHPHRNPYRKAMHLVDRLDEQLFDAGIEETYPIDISWLKSDISKFNLPKNFAILVVGSDQDKKEVRWTDEGFVKVAEWFADKGMTPVFIGSNHEKGLIASIVHQCVKVKTINLVNQTIFADIVELAENAIIAIGNDTGPMQLIAATECPSILLYSPASNPNIDAPRRNDVRIIDSANLALFPARKLFPVIEELLGIDSLRNSSKPTEDNIKEEKQEMEETPILDKNKKYDKQPEDQEPR